MYALQIHRPPSEKQIIKIYEKQIKKFYRKYLYTPDYPNVYATFTDMLLIELNATDHYELYPIIRYACWLACPTERFKYPHNFPEELRYETSLKCWKLFFTYHKALYCFDYFFDKDVRYIDYDFYIELYFISSELNTTMSNYGGPILRRKIMDKAYLEENPQFVVNLQEALDQNDKQQTLDLVTGLRRQNNNNNNVNPGRAEEEDRFPIELVLFVIFIVGMGCLQLLH